MSEQEDLAAIRALIRQRPDIVLHDIDLMRDLAAHTEGHFGDNVVDFRDAALHVISRRRDILEQSNRTITQKSQQNLASAKRIQKATLTLIQAPHIDAFCATLKDPVQSILEVDHILILVESPFPSLKPNPHFGPVKSCHHGLVAEYAGGKNNLKSNRIVLRSCPQISANIYPRVSGPEIRSEALLPLNLGTSQQNDSLMLLGSQDPHAFQPGMGTDLLVYFQQVVESLLRRWSA